MIDTREQIKRHRERLKERRGRVRGMVALGRIASRVPLDQVMDVLHKRHDDEASREQSNRGLRSCNGRWALFQFTQPRDS